MCPNFEKETNLLDEESEMDMRLTFAEACATLAPTTSPLMIRLSMRHFKLKSQKRRSVASWETMFRLAGLVKAKEAAPVEEQPRAFSSYEQPIRGTPF